VLQNFKAALQVNFLLNYVEKCVLNVMGEDIETTDTASGAVKCDVSQNVVFAGKQKLEESKERDQISNFDCAVDLIIKVLLKQ
jgi:hypothetical protein